MVLPEGTSPFPAPGRHQLALLPALLGCRAQNTLWLSVCLAPCAPRGETLPGPGFAELSGKGRSGGKARRQRQVRNRPRASRKRRASAVVCVAEHAWVAPKQHLGRPAAGVLVWNRAWCGVGSCCQSRAGTGMEDGGFPGTGRVPGGWWHPAGPQNHLLVRGRSSGTPQAPGAFGSDEYKGFASG